MNLERECPYSSNNFALNIGILCFRFELFLPIENLVDNIDGKTLIIYWIAAEIGNTLTFWMNI